MEMYQESHRKRFRVTNGKLSEREGHLDEEEDEGETRGEVNNCSSNNQMIRQWHHPSSRIFRVSRASGGKDRHSKVYTSKGLRDRRVRLSVSTAIQFYDLQDRLGYDQPSKAIEWLIKSAAPAIAELPSLDTTFPELLQPLNTKKLSDSMIDPEADPSYNQQQNSSTSETSKGSVLSLSRSEIRVKARERARERVKEKDRDDTGHVVSHQNQNVDPSLNSQGSFTKLLTGHASSSAANFIQKQMQSLPPVTSTADYFGIQSNNVFSQQHLPQTKATHQTHSGFSSQVHFGNNSPPIGMVPFMSNANGAGDHPAELQQFSFFQDHFFPLPANGGEYNLNFSPSLAGFHRGTLQSNSPSHHHQVQAQRISPAFDGSSMPFFLGTAAMATPNENTYSSGLNGHLHLCDGDKHLELKGKGKS